MRVTVLLEAGYEQALLGLSLSYGRPVEGMPAVARRLRDKMEGHNKFLEQIVVWLDVTAARYWWQQMDTYRVGVSKQSESTMHTILKRPLGQHDFEGELPLETLERLNSLIERGEFDQLKKELPESFLQRRIVSLNYKAIRRMILQRRQHRLPEWHLFCREMRAQLQHPELIEDLFGGSLADLG